MQPSLDCAHHPRIALTACCPGTIPEKSFLHTLCHQDIPEKQNFRSGHDAATVRQSSELVGLRAKVIETNSQNVLGS